MNLLCLGLDHQTSKLEERERLAYSAPQLPSALSGMREALSGFDPEVVILSTCNRTEFYLSTETGPEEVRESLLRHLSQSREIGLPGERFFFHVGDECVRHLFEVASGLQSMVIGETEVLGQTKSAYQAASQEGTTGKYLNRLFQTAFSAAKQVRSETEITRGTVSVGSVAVELAGQIIGDLRRANVLILGAGDTGERVARSLMSRGAKAVFVANRTFERASALAGELGGKAVRWDEWDASLQHADIVISSTAAPHYVVNRAELKKALPRRGYRPLFLIDLSVPRDVDPSVIQLDSVYLYDLDDLQGIANEHLAERKVAIEQARHIIQVHMEKFKIWLGSTGRSDERRSWWMASQMPDLCRRCHRMITHPQGSGRP